MGRIRIHQEQLSKAYSEIEKAAKEVRTLHSDTAKSIESHIKPASFEIGDLLNEPNSQSKPGYISIDEHKLHSAHGHVMKALDIIHKGNDNSLHGLLKILTLCEDCLQENPQGKHHGHSASGHSSSHHSEDASASHHGTHRQPPQKPQPYHKTHSRSEKKDDDDEDQYAVVDKRGGEGHRPAHDTGHGHRSHHSQEEKPPPIPPKRKDEKPPLPPKRKDRHKK